MEVAEVDRDALLVEFQAFTGIDDIDECTTILEQHDWILKDAVNTILAGYDDVSRTVNPPHQPTENLWMNHLEGVAHFQDTRVHNNMYWNLPSSSLSQNHLDIQQRLINFRVDFRNQEMQLVVPDSQSIGKLKELLSEKTSIPCSRIELHGWVHKNDAYIKDLDLLRDLNLPKDNHLYMLAPDCPNLTSNSQNIQESIPLNYELKIKCPSSQFELNFPSSHTILEVKSDIYSLTNIPVRHQSWTGWPSSTTDSSRLCDLNLQQVTEVEMQKIIPDTPASTSVVASASYQDDIDLEYDSCDLLEESHPPITEPLLPENSLNPILSAQYFSHQFEIRYGCIHPEFFIGSINDAVKASFSCPAREQRILALYLHHDGSIFSNVFCSQILCSSVVTSLLNSSFTTWAWDLTFDSNAQLLIDTCTTLFGSIVGGSISQRRSYLDHLPVVLLISRHHGFNEVIDTISGASSINEVLDSLANAYEVHKNRLQTDIIDENERLERDMLRKEQEDAYKLSLAADRAKESEHKQKQEEEQKEAIKIQQQLDEKNAMIKIIETDIPDEPPLDSKKPTISFRIRCPDGKPRVRRFYRSNHLGDLLNYITVEGFQMTDYKVLVYPRKDLSKMEQILTFEEIGLHNQETIILEEL